MQPTPPAALIFVQEYGSPTENHHERGRNNKGQDPVFIHGTKARRIRLAPKCNKAAAANQPSTPKASSDAAMADRKPLTLYTNPASGVAMPIVKHAVEARSMAFAKSLVCSFSTSGIDGI